MWGAADLIEGCSRPAVIGSRDVIWDTRAEWLSRTQIWSPTEYRALASALTGVRSIWSLGHQNEIRLYTLYTKSKARDLRYLLLSKSQEIRKGSRWCLSWEWASVPHRALYRCPPHWPWQVPTWATGIIETVRNTRNYNEPG